MAASQIFILTAVLYIQILMCINSELYKINIRSDDWVEVIEINSS